MNKQLIKHIYSDIVSLPKMLCSLPFRWKLNFPRIQLILMLDAGINIAYSYYEILNQTVQFYWTRLVFLLVRNNDPC